MLKFSVFVVLSTVIFTMVNNPQIKKERQLPDNTITCPKNNVEQKDIPDNVIPFIIPCKKEEYKS